MHHPQTLADWEQLAQQIEIPNTAFINNEPYQANGEKLDIINPATREVLAQVASCTKEDIDYAVRCAREAFRDGRWSKLPRAERKQRLLRLAELIRENLAELALMDALDMGKRIMGPYAGRGRVSADHFAWFAELVAKQYDETAATDDVARATITREHLGVVAAVVPWNYPLRMATWKVA